MAVHETAQIEDSDVGDAEVREYVTIHDSTLAAGVRIYERTSIKKSEIAGPTDVNANCYVENARLGSRVQVGPNTTIAGVTHDLSDQGMEFRNDRFEEIVIEDGAFVGAGATVLPGVEIGENAVVGAGTTVAQDVDPGTVRRSGSEPVTRRL